MLKYTFAKPCSFMQRNNKARGYFIETILRIMFWCYPMYLKREKMPNTPMRFATFKNELGSGMRNFEDSVQELSNL